MKPAPYMGGAIPVQLPAVLGEGFLYPEAPDTLWVNSGRAAFECLLRGMPELPPRVWVPRFICDTLLEPLARLHIPVARYAVDAALRPVLPAELAPQDVLVAVNYFGLTGAAVAATVATAPCRVVVDATTALYSPPLPGVPTFYSPRKFAGLADGGVAVGVKALPWVLPVDAGSDARTAALLQQYNDSAVQAAEDALSAPPKRMGTLTRHLLCHTPWQAVARQRILNYGVLHRALGDINRLPLPQVPAHAPMCYPLVCGIPGLRDALIDAGVRLPLYWPEVIEKTDAGDTENRLARTLLPLPLDQRYSERDMERLVALVLN